MQNPTPTIALVVPCYNEAATIATVIQDFRAVLPRIACYVFDNNSDDDTVAVARAAGAEVRQVRLRGKGNVVHRIFADIEADIYIMVDGDATYDASAAPALVEKIVAEDLDMVVGSRVSDETQAYRPGHRFGNKLLTGFVGMIFGRSFTDMLSGYRVFSRRFVKSFPAHARGFETETELAVHALELRMAVAEVPTRYAARPEGSVSKLRTYSDGWRILATILRLFKAERPLVFFSIGFIFCQLAAIGLALPIIATFLETGLVPRIPTAVLSASIVLLGFLFLVCGLILETVTLGRIEAKRLRYLQIPGLRSSFKR
jgi:glycosyltransferase involved in cell wall biosynthesis